MKRYIYKAIIFLLLFFPSVCSSYADSQKLTIVFTGDMAGAIEAEDGFGGLSRRYKYIAELRKGTDGFLLFELGDNLPMSVDKPEKKATGRELGIILETFNRMKYDAMNIGESDLALGEALLRKREPSLDFPLISLNILDTYTNSLFFTPYIIKEVKNNLKIGIAGLISENYKINSDRLKIVPHKEALSRFLPEIKAKSDIIILLAHIGFADAVKLMRSFDDIDVILCGHWEIEAHQEPLKIKNTIIMPSFYKSKRIGKLDLEIEGNKIQSYNWHSEPLDANYDEETIVQNLIADINNPEPLKITFFYKTGCMACLEIEQNLLPQIQQKYGNKIFIEGYDTFLTKNYENTVKFENLYRVEGGQVPCMFIGQYYLKGKDEIIARLDNIIQTLLAANAAKEDGNKPEALPVDVPAPPVDAKSIIMSRFESFSAQTVFAAGLLDGVNPCAFATIIFFISFLSLIGYKKRELLLTGVSFSLSVFITYIMIGLGVFHFLRSLKSFFYISRGLYTAISIAAYGFGIISFIDYLRFRKDKDAKNIILQLPRSIQNKIHSVIGADYRGDRKTDRRTAAKLIFTAITIGFIVSVLESFCTGQVYLPTIMFVLQLPDKTISSIGYLIIYNIGFIIPLLIVFLLAFFGTASSVVSKFMRRHIGDVKLLTAVLFFLLGSLLIIFR